MKRFNKQILEAINRGLKLALDDFEEQSNEPIAPKREIIKNKNSTKNLIWLHDNFVDLELPSGTLWAKYNLGVDPKKLDTKNDWYGDYYAWGEVEPNKTNYDWKTYKFAKDTFDKLTKYCNNKSEYCYDNKADDLIQLLPEDDAAYQNMHIGNFKFRIPTKKQFEELLHYTTLDSVYMYNTTGGYNNVPGLNGVVLKSKINGNELFIPFAGYYEFDGPKSVDKLTFLWSSDVCSYPPSTAWRLHVYSNEICLDDNAGRCKGYKIRPVINL